MGGFFLLGGLMALLGASIPVWVNFFHLDDAMAAHYFLAFNVGIFAEVLVSRSLLGGLGLRGVLVMACALVAAGLLAMGEIYSAAWMIAPLLALGFAAGMLTTGVSWLMFDAMTAPAASTILSLAGAFFGSGAVLFTLLLWVHARPRSLQLAAVLPALLAVQYWRQPALGEPALQAMPLRLPAGATRSGVALLLAAALFFQSAGEWTAAGWLAVYWIRKLGVSRQTGLFALALYWAALTLSKLLAPRIPWPAGRFRLASLSSGLALFGCVVLLAAAGKGGAAVGAVCLGAGLGGVYPITVGMIAERFPYYHPGFFNGFLSLSLVGGMLGPWSVGLLVHASAIEWAAWMLGAAVLMTYLVLVILLVEARVSQIVDSPSSE